MVRTAGVVRVPGDPAGALKPAWKPDNSPVDLMEEFYRNHGDDPETAGKVVLDPFMGGRRSDS